MVYILFVLINLDTPYGYITEFCMMMGMLSGGFAGTTLLLTRVEKAQQLSLRSGTTEWLSSTPMCVWL